MIVGPRRMQRIVNRKRRVEITHREVLVGEQHVEMRHPRRLVAQDPRLLQRLFKFLPLVQYVDIIKSARVELRLKLNRGFKDEFGFVEDLEARAEIGKHAHRFEMMAVGLKEVPAQPLCLQQLALMHEAGHAHQLRRQARQPVKLVARDCFVICMPGRLVELDQQPPTGNKCRVGRHGVVKSCDGTVGIAGRTPAMAYFLPSAGVFRLDLEQSLEGLPRRNGATNIALGHGQQIQKIDIVRIGGQQRLDDLPRPGERTLLQLATGLLDASLDSCGVLILVFHCVGLDPSRAG